MGGVDFWDDPGRRRLQRRECNEGTLTVGGILRAGDDDDGYSAGDRYWCITGVMLVYARGWA